MSDTIPEQYIITSSLQIPLSNYQVDFTVQYTLWGELIAANSLTKALPVNARKMIYGADFKNVERRIDELPQLLRYQLPLALTNNVHLPYLQPAVAAAKSAQNIEGIDLKTVLKEYCQDPWLLFFYNVEKRLPEKKLATIIPQLAILVQGNEKKIFKAVRALQKTAPQLIFMPVLHSLVPFQRAELRRYLYNQIGETRLLINRDFLLKQLAEEAESYLCAKIINGLTNYSNKIVHERLIEHYQSTKWTRGKYRELRALATKLKNYQNDAIIPIAQELLLLHDSKISGMAREMLFQRGMTEAAFVEFLPDFFDDELLVIQVDILLNHYLALQNLSLLPTPDQLLQLIMLYGQRYPSAGSPMKLFQKLALLFQKNFSPAYYVNVYELLRYNEDSLQRSGLNLLSQLIHRFPLIDADEIGTKIIRQLFTLAHTAWAETRAASLVVLQQLASQHATPDWLKSLQELSKHSNHQVQTAALQALIAVLQAHKALRKDQLRFLVSFLDSKEENIQKLALEGLQLYPRQRVEKVIGGMADG